VNDWIWLGISMAALMAGAILSTLVQALRDLSRSALEEIVSRRGSRAAADRISRILEDLDGHAAATALPRTFFNLVVAVSLVLWITAVRHATDPTWLDGLIGIIVASLLLWVFTTVLPASVARHAGESTVYTWSRVLRVMYAIGRPLRLLASGIDKAVRRLVGKADQTPAQAVQEEILTAIEDAQVEGGVDETERDMIEAVVKFRERTVAQVMTPRTEMKAIELSNNLGEVTAAIREIGHSRIPVYTESIDRIVGIFYVKDLMRWLAGEGSRGGRTFDLKSLLRPAYFVPATKTVRELLAELLKKRVHIALVADEYGGTAGLVTFEDIVEEVFGDIQDEYEIPQESNAEVRINLADKSAEIDARAYLSDTNDELRSVGLELPESEEYDTVGGFVTMTLGRIPGPGEAFTHAGLKVKILSAEPTRVTRIRVEAAAPVEAVTD